MSGLRAVVIGGVAGGASAAARLRRLADTAAVVMVERGRHVSFANCGLPYAVAGETVTHGAIESRTAAVRQLGADYSGVEESLIVTTPAVFEEQFRIEVLLETEVTRIERGAKRLHLCRGGEAFSMEYDKLVLAVGAAPIVPNWPGVQSPAVFSLRTIPDVTRVRGWLGIDKEMDGEAVRTAVRGKRAVVVGAGFIGLEMAEMFNVLGLHVTVLDAASHLLPPFDWEMAAYLKERLETEGIRFALSDAVAALHPHAATDEGGKETVSVECASGAVFDADIVVLAIGVRPESHLATEAGLEVGPRGGVAVNAHMQTSDEDVYAVGDVVDCLDLVTGTHHGLALAGPANRQGRVAASHIAASLGSTAKADSFRGVLGTSVLGAAGMSAAMTGASEATLRRCGWKEMHEEGSETDKERVFSRIYLHPGSHVSYFPGATPIHIKLLFNPFSGRILGAQAVGEHGAPRRIDVIATTMLQEGTVRDLAELELCYSPQHGAAKDPVNMAGMLASNVMDGLVDVRSWDDALVRAVIAGSGPEGTAIVDVRTAAEYARGHVRHSVNVPYETLRENMDALPETPLFCCIVGQRAYNCARIHAQRSPGKAAIVSGGFKSLIDMATVDSGLKAAVVGELWDPNA